MLRNIGLVIVLVAIPFLTLDQYVLSQKKREITVTVHVPTENARVSIDDRAFTLKGTKRVVQTTVDTGKDSVKVSASWEPNGYTKITRSTEISIKGKSKVIADLSKKIAGSPDDITVIFVPTPDDVVEEMAKLGKVTKEDIVYDLGCGDGRIVIAAVKKFGAKQGVGIDLDATRVKESRANARKHGVDDRVEFRQGNVLKIDDLSKANVVMLYMGDFINLRLRPILKKTLQPGSRIVSHRFTMGDWEPTKTISVAGKNGFDYQLHLWVITEKSRAEGEAELKAESSAKKE